MASQDVEIRFPLLNPDAVIAFLNAHATPGKAGVVQKDTYLVPPHRDFLAVEYPYEWLRLRETQKGASLDYKHFHPENVAVTEYCDEFQTPVGDAASLRRILDALDFRECIVVEKTRSVWQLRDVEVAIDAVAGLGTFIELELTRAAEPAEGKAYLRSIIEELGAQVGDEDFRGYPYLILAASGRFSQFP